MNVRGEQSVRYAAAGGPNQVISASASPRWVRSPTQATLSVGPDQYGAGRSDPSKYRKFPHTIVFGVDQLNPACPGSDVKAAGFIEVEEHRSGSVQQGEDPQWAVGADHVEIGHATTEQRVLLAEVVVNVQTRHDRGVSLARLVHP